MSSLINASSNQAESRGLRSTSRGDAVVPKTNRNYGKRAFAVAGPTAWNSLPVQILRANTVKKFKSALKTHLFSIHYPTEDWILFFIFSCVGVTIMYSRLRARHWFCLGVSQNVSCIVLYSPVTILLLLQLFSCKPQLWGEIECDAASFWLLSSKRRFLLLLVWPDANVIINSISWCTGFFTPGTNVLVLDLAHHCKLHAIRYGI